jgi:hypothetical protein
LTNSRTKRFFNIVFPSALGMETYWPIDLARLITQYLSTELQLIILGNDTIELEQSFDTQCKIINHKALDSYAVIIVEHTTIAFKGPCFVKCSMFKGQSIWPDEDLFERMSNTFSPHDMCFCRINMLRQQLTKILNNRITNSRINFRASKMLFSKKIMNTCKPFHFQLVLQD